MSFSPAWLALREPADHAARAPAPLAALAAHFAGRDAVSVVDLGCGAGSNLRGTFAALPDRQRWRLVDHDPALLAAARERLAAWADAAEAEGGTLMLAKAGKRLAVTFATADLAADLDGVIAPEADLVTAAALFDLVSPAWIEDFVARIAARRLPFYTVLTYDGTELWQPPHPADAAVFAAFHAHQHGDKGFGPAAGPEAAAIMAGAFRRAGYRVDLVPSPWRRAGRQAELMRELAVGLAAAAAETGRIEAPTVEAWLTARLAAASCEIGHQDLVALPA